MASLSKRRGTNCTDAEWDEYLKIGNVSSNETPTEWMNRIWSRLQYFRENDLLPTNSKKYLEARKLIIYWSEVNGFYKSYVPEIGIAICFSCNQLAYTSKRTKNIRNYNHIGMERHWASHCTGNSYCGVSYDEYLLKIKKKSISGYDYDNEHVLHHYKLWESNAVKKIQHAREVGKKIQAINIIS
ncbi:27464_t:CDS:1 [Gigaspora margarita]|uniref:27464_t:CDS:1 n=1 Tax=Gigaspora margarita TaxID=4874 RepID=A0ABN7WNX5_GIGMA|nr:27464_t:CDS:1 [Gigaspora margarita]